MQNIPLEILDHIFSFIPSLHIVVLVNKLWNSRCIPIRIDNVTTLKDRALSGDLFSIIWSRDYVIGESKVALRYLCKGKHKEFALKLVQYNTLQYSYQQLVTLGDVQIIRNISVDKDIGLEKAAKVGDLNMVKFLFRNRHHHRAFEKACKYGHLHIVKFLSRYISNVSMGLYKACKNRMYETIEFLQNLPFNSILVMQGACRSGDLSLVKRFYVEGEFLQHSSTLEISKYLVDMGDRSFNIGLLYSRSYEISKYMLECGAFNIGEAFLRACELGDENMVDLLIHEGNLLEGSYKAFWRKHYGLATRLNKDIVPLIQAAKGEIPDEKSVITYTVALNNGHIKVADALFERSYNRGSMGIYAIKGDTKVVEFLINKEISHPDIMLYYAVWGCRINTIKRILELGVTNVKRALDKAKELKIQWVINLLEKWPTQCSSSG